MTLPANVLARIERTEGCWLWNGNHHRLGYALVYHGGRTTYAHRVVYESEVCPIPKGMELDHLCRNRGCVNPAHLEPVTHQENMRRSPVVMARPERCQRGHPIDYVRANGRRGCKTCRRDATRRWRERHGIPEVTA